ncbi:uncharacterized protein ACN2A1_014942 isoform 1-T1 [Glossina fuscipes fuscipes]
MAANFCKRFLAAKRNLKNVQGNYGYKNNTTHQPSKTYGKYLWIIGGGATAIICINLFKSGTNSVKAFNMRHSKIYERLCGGVPARPGAANHAPSAPSAVQKKKKKGAERRNEERRSNCRVKIYDIKLNDLSAAEIITLQRNGAEAKKISK